MPKLSKPKPENLPWEVYEKQGEIRGRTRGIELAEKYIAILEEAWGSRPTPPRKLEAACKWIEEQALEELNDAPGWDSLKLVVCRYSPTTPEGRALDMRIWRAFRSGAVRAIREVLTHYGCASYLRFMDMDAFLRYYRGEES